MLEYKQEVVMVVMPLVRVLDQDLTVLMDNVPYILEPTSFLTTPVS